MWQQYANCNLSVLTTCVLPWTWTPTATGTFTVEIGVFSTDWTSNYAWNGNAGTITVSQTSAVLSLSSSATLSTTTLTLGQTLTITTTVNKLSGSLPSCIVDVEAYTPTGVKKMQQYKDNQSFNSAGKITNTWTWVPAAKGTYTIMVGVFDNGWTTNYHWNGGAASVTVV